MTSQQLPWPGVVFWLSRSAPRLTGLLWLMVAAATLVLFAGGLYHRYDDLSQRYRPRLGLSVYRDRSGDLALSPWPADPAQLAGILEGDRLVAVNGVPPRAVPPEDALPAGAAGQAVTLSVRTGDRPVRDYTLFFGGQDPLAVASLGLSAGFISAYTVAIDLVMALAGLGVAGLLVWRRPGDWRVLLFSISVLLAQVGASSPILALYDPQPFWRPVLDAWFALTLTAWWLFFYLFPDGKFVPRWTLGLAILAGAWWLAQGLYPALYPWRLPALLGFGVLLAWFASGVVAQVYRYQRHSSPAERLQTKWVVLGLTGTALAALAQFAVVIWPVAAGVPQLAYDLVGYPLTQLLRVLLPVTIGIAILRYRLWDIDLIFNRTLVYAGLTASVVAIYGLCVGLAGALIQSGAAGAGSVVATGLVAVIAQPLRDRLQRGVNRLMYGERDDPVTVLNRLSRRLEAATTPDALLPSLVENVAQALKLPWVAVELDQVGAAPETVAFPPGGRPPADPVRLPLVYQGEPVGRLLAAQRTPGEAFSPLDQHLLENIARQAGLAVHAVGLNRELQRARQRSVAALEEERRRLRRDLHDGLGPALASQGLKLAAARQQLRTDPDAALALIDSVLAQNHETVADVRRLVYGLRPPALDERGLAEAIRDHLGQAPLNGLRVVVEDLPAETPPLPAAVEVAAYRIALEALTNIIRHARARLGIVRFSCGPAGTTFQVEIEDDGAGLPAGLRAGVGLRSMRERAEELGGTLHIGPRANGGTLIRASLPLRSG